MSIFHTDIPPADLAREYVLEAMLVEALPVLGRAILGNADTAYLMQQNGYGTLTAAMVDIGDLEVMPPLKDGGWLQLRVEGAGHREGLDVLSSMAYINSGTRDTFYTSVYGYLHNDAFRDTRKMLQSRARETALRILSGWLRGRVLNYIGLLEDGVTKVNRRILKLASMERVDVGMLGGDGLQLMDQLSDCFASEGHTGYFVRQFSSEVLYGVQFRHVGILQG